VIAVMAVGLAGCGRSSKPVSYQQRLRNLEALYTRCGNEPSDHDYGLCLRRNEDTIKSYLEHLCPHPGGYTFEGAHEPCPSGPPPRAASVHSASRPHRPKHSESKETYETGYIEAKTNPLLGAAEK
jgi:hypothetical protein